MGLLTVGARPVSDLFVCSWDPLLLTELPCPALIQGFVCLVLLYLVKLHSVDIPGTCSFLEEMVEIRIWGRGEERGWEKWRGNCGQGVLYERRIDFQKTKTRKLKKEVWPY